MAFTRNTGRIAENVKIILADGTKAWTRVMPRNKGVTLPEGAKIDPHWHVQHGHKIKHFDGDHTPAWTKQVATTTTSTGATDDNTTDKA